MWDPLVSLGLAVVAGIVWAVRLEGRINGHDSMFAEREKQQASHLADVTARLVRIEQKLDRQNGNGHHVAS